MKKYIKGFTLVELLVVIAIIGILSTIIIANVSSSKASGRDAKRITDIKNLQLSLELYYNDYNQYPTTLGALVPIYLSTLPSDPSSSVACSTGAQSSCYKYAIYGANPTINVCLTSNPPLSYHLGALLESTSNSALTKDLDGASSETYCTIGPADFSGTGAGVSGQCSSASGTPQPGGTELCYDVNQS